MGILSDDRVPESIQRAFGAPPTMQACNCLGPAPGEHLCPCMKNQQARQEAQWRRDWQEKLDAIPAVAPDNDPEDTINRFSGIVPPFLGYLPRGHEELKPLLQSFYTPDAHPTVEDQITESDHRDSRDLEIFILGALAGACWAGLVALVIL